MKFSLSIPNPEAWIINHKDDLEINWSDKAVSLHLNKENSFNLYLLDDEITIGMLIGHFLYQDESFRDRCSAVLALAARWCGWTQVNIESLASGQPACRCAKGHYLWSGGFWAPVT